MHPSLALLQLAFFLPFLIFIVNFIFPHDTPCSYTLLLLFLLPLFSQNHSSFLQSAHILFPVLITFLFSCHFYKLWLVWCGYYNFCCSSIVFLFVHYFFFHISQATFPLSYSICLLLAFPFLSSELYYFPFLVSIVFLTHYFPPFILSKSFSFTVD